MKIKNKYFNPNPSKKTDGSDCVVRAICKAEDKEWLDVYKELCELGMELFSMPSSDKVWKTYLERKGYEKFGFKRGQKRMTVDEFARKHKEGTYILNIANHLVCCENGYYYDTWDCGEYTLYTYYRKC